VKRTVLVAGVALIALLAPNAASAVDNYYFGPEPPYLWGRPLPYPKDWDRRIGWDFWTRLLNYYALEWGHADAPPDP